jgi:hypothetical protein
MKVTDVYVTRYTKLCKGLRHDEGAHESRVTRD